MSTNEYMEPELTQEPIQGFVDRLYKKLIIGTHHDKIVCLPHPHKILGYGALIHFVFRYFILLFTGSMYFSNTLWDLFVPLYHLTLSLSSFLFHVKEKRNFKFQLIWKELQLHNIVFTSRSCAIFTYLTLFPNDPASSYLKSIIFRAIIVIFFHILADIVSNKYGQDKTMRDMSYNNSIIPANIKKIFDLYYALSQFGAISALIFAKSGREYAIMIMFSIQISTFLMTLNLKGIISQDMWHILYAISLLGSWYLPTRSGIQELVFFPAIIIFFAIWRILLKQNKYIGIVLSVLFYRSLYI